MKPSEFSVAGITPHQGDPNQQSISLYQGTVTRVLEPEAGYEIDQNRVARQAYSCLIQPCVGDRVLVSSSTEPFIVAVLERTQPQPACLQLPTDDPLTLRNQDLSLQAEQSLKLSSLAEMELNVPLGTLRWNAHHVFSTVTGNWVQQVNHHLQRVRQFALEATQLLRLHGKHQFITADQDIKIDGERINMG